MKRTFSILPAIIFVALFTYSQPAHATLGGTADTVTADQQVLSARHRSTAFQNGYTVKEIMFGSTTVREYISAGGIVFGIAWNGYAHPDLTQLLGTYAGEYSTALKKAQRTHGRRHQRLATDNIIVETGGHMRNLQGRAYVPALVPGGVQINDIK